MRPSTRLRQLLKEPGIIVAPGAYDGFSARLIEAAGFSCVYMTGAGTAASHLGQPDLGLATLTEMANHAGHLAACVSLPVIADADTGYGNVLNAVRTVREYERAGVAGLHMEDQVAPKKCGHIAGKQVISTQEFCDKIRAASEYRTDPDFVIIARTDARAVTSLEDAIDRGNRAAEAGADVIFVEAPQTEDEIQLIAREVKAPLLANMVPGGKTPAVKIPELERLGFKIVIFPAVCMAAAVPAMERALTSLRETGTDWPEGPVLSPMDIFRKVGFDWWHAIEEKFSPPLIGGFMRATSKLRELLGTGQTLFVPGCYNALSAKILETVGFPAVYMTGYGTSLSLLGLPDAGLATMTEMHLNARYIANAVSVPVIADADNGYGNAIGVIRTVREYIQTGVAGIHLEDQAIPKRCGHVAGRRVISLEEAVGKYRAADTVRRDLDPDFVLIARTDARGAHGGSLDEAIRRANAYLEAGADLAFVEGPTSVDEVRRICKEVHGPVFYNQTGISPRFSLEEMRELGIAVTILPGATFRATIQAVYDLARDLRERGPVAEADFNERFKAHPLGNIHTFAGFDQVREWEEEYLPAEEMEKYTDSVGHQPAKS